MKTGKMASGALVVVIAGGAMTTEPRGMQGDELESEGDTYIPCLGEYIHDVGSLAGPMLLMQYRYRLTFHPSGELAVYRKTPPKGDWTRCFGPSY